MDALPTLDLSALRDAYLQRRLTPSALIDVLLQRIATTSDRNIWISLMPEAQLRQRARELEQRDPTTLPLYGVPFAIKDNIDLVGLPTTAGCREFSYLPERSAPVVQKLWSVPARPGVPVATASMPTTSAVVPAAARRWRWHWASAALRWVPIPLVRGAYRPLSIT